MTSPETILPEPVRNAFRAYGVFVAVLCLCFAWPLFRLARHAAGSELYSHVLLVPFVTAFLVWSERRRIPVASRPGLGGAIVCGLAGLAALAAFVLLKSRGASFGEEDFLSLTIFAFVSLLGAGGFLLLGRERVRAVGFPLAFLIFLVPFPEAVTHGIEFFFQHTTAEACDWMFRLIGMSMLRDGLVFRLPGIGIEVAEECSGIRSSLVLFLTCLLAGHLFLRKPWMRAALALAVIPVGIFRNALRIVTISMLCVHVDREMIHSWIHTHGGPVFFVVSLVPLFVMVWFFRRHEGGATQKADSEKE